MNFHVVSGDILKAFIVFVGLVLAHVCSHLHVFACLELPLILGICTIYDQSRTNEYNGPYLMANLTGTL